MTQFPSLKLRLQGRELTLVEAISQENVMGSYLKNIVIFIISSLVTCILMIIFSHLGVNDKLNMCITALLYGALITFYFKHTTLCLVMLSLFYLFLLILSFSLDIFIMFILSNLSFLIIQYILPYLKNIKIEEFNLKYKNIDKSEIENI
jgi:hypothetical protein